MTHYLVSFPSSAMSHVRDDQWDEVGRSARQVVQQAREAGVLVFAGGLAEDVPPVRVSADGSVHDDLGPAARPLDGGFCVLDLPTRQAAQEWAARLAAGCWCDQELRQFGEGAEV